MLAAIRAQIRTAARIRQFFPAPMVLVGGPGIVVLRSYTGRPIPWVGLSAGDHDQPAFELHHQYCGGNRYFLVAGDSRDASMGWDLVGAGWKFYLL